MAEQERIRDPLVLVGSIRRDEFADLRVDERNLVALLTEHFGPFQARAHDDALPGDEYKITVERVEKPEDPWRWFVAGALEAVVMQMRHEEPDLSSLSAKLEELRDGLIAGRDMAERLSTVSDLKRQQIEALVHQIEYEYLEKIPQGDMDDTSGPVRDARHNLAMIRQVLARREDEG